MTINSSSDDNSKNTDSSNNNNSSSDDYKTDTIIIKTDYSNIYTIGDFKYMSPNPMYDGQVKFWRRSRHQSGMNTAQWSTLRQQVSDNTADIYTCLLYTSPSPRD